MNENVENLKSLGVILPTLDFLPSRISKLINGTRTFTKDQIKRSVTGAVNSLNEALKKSTISLKTSQDTAVNSLDFYLIYKDEWPDYVSQLKQNVVVLKSGKTNRKGDHVYLSIRFNGNKESLQSAPLRRLLPPVKRQSTPIKDDDSEFGPSQTPPGQQKDEDSDSEFGPSQTPPGQQKDEDSDSEFGPVLPAGVNPRTGVQFKKTGSTRQRKSAGVPEPKGRTFGMTRLVPTSKIQPSAKVSTDVSLNLHPNDSKYFDKLPVIRIMYEGTEQKLHVGYSNVLYAEKDKPYGVALGPIIQGRGLEIFLFE